MGLPDENIHPHATGRAATTVAEHQEPQDLIFYSGWVRATEPSLAEVELSEHNVTVDHDLIPRSSARTSNEPGSSLRSEASPTNTRRSTRTKRKLTS